MAAAVLIAGTTVIRRARGVRLRRPGRQPALSRMLSILIAGSLLIASTLSALQVTNAANVNLTVDGAQQGQRIVGFGVNANPKYWNGGALIPALDLLVDQLGADIWRVDIFGRS